MHCDLCNETISANELVRVPLREMQRAVRNGYNPFKSRRMSGTVRLGKLGGLSTNEMYLNWSQKVLSDTTDWGLCPPCAKHFQAASGERALPKYRKKKTERKKWWQFWK